MGNLKLSYDPHEQLALNWIQNATYEEMYRRWRTATAADPMMAGSMGQHFLRELDRKGLRLSIAQEEAAREKVKGEIAEQLRKDEPHRNDPPAPDSMREIVNNLEEIKRLLISIDQNTERER